MLLHTLIILGFVYLFFRQHGNEEPILFSIAFMSKVAGAILLGYFYLRNASSSDSWNFYFKGCKIADIARKDVGAYFDFILSNQFNTVIVDHWFFFGDRLTTMNKLVSFFCLIGDNNYWICALYFSLISFLSSWYIYVKIRKLNRHYARAAAVAIFFIPSVIFWSSGIVKETLALASIFYFTALFVQWLSGHRLGWWQIVLVFPALYLTWVLKYYWLGIFMAVLFATIILIFISRKKTFNNWQWVGVWSLIFIALVAIVSLTHPNFYFNRILTVIVESHDLFVIKSSPDNIIHYTNLQPNVWSILQNSPLAIISGLWRPFVWEARNATTWMASVESFFILLITLSWLFTFRKNRFTLTFFPLLVYCVIMIIFFALSTPNFGALSRYRVGFLPFFVFMLLYANPAVDNFMNRILFFIKKR